jgi:hypothetical protein
MRGNIDIMLTKLQYANQKQKMAELKYGKFAPTEINCFYFNVCCEMGTRNGCKHCKKKRLKNWMGYRK